LFTRMHRRKATIGVYLGATPASLLPPGQDSQTGK
jgi:hypothetical protein